MTETLLLLALAGCGALLLVLAMAWALGLAFDRGYSLGYRHASQVPPYPELEPTEPESPAFPSPAGCATAWLAALIALEIKA